MSVICYLGFLKVGNFNSRSDSVGQYASPWQNVVPIGKTIAEIWPFFKMAAVHHVGFSKIQNFNSQSSSEGQCASSCQS